MEIRLRMQVTYTSTTHSLYVTSFLSFSLPQTDPLYLGVYIQS